MQWKRIFVAEYLTVQVDEAGKISVRKDKEKGRQVGRQKPLFFSSFLPSEMMKKDQLDIG